MEPEIIRTYSSEEETGFKLLILLFFLVILSSYINFKILIIIVLTYKNEIKTTYYPILLIMVFISNINSLGFILGVYLIVTDSSLEPFVYPGFFIATTPSLISLLDLILCVYRCSIFFGWLDRSSNHFRWVGPIIFLASMPLVVYVSFVSQVYTYFENDFRDTFFFVGFIIDMIIRCIFALVSFSGYLCILAVLYKNDLRNRDRSEDSYILKQALPISSFLLFSALVQIIIELPFNLGIKGTVPGLLLSFCLSCACSIVVPLSIILASSQKRALFKKACCDCYKSVSPIHVGS